MSTVEQSTGGTTDREMVITRLIDAPPELVFDAWTDPKHVGQWWGPDGFTTTTNSIDVRPGGHWRFVMHGPDGRDYQNRIAYVEIVKPQRLVYRHCGVEDDADVGFESTVTFERQGEQTLVMMRAVFPTIEERDRVIREYGALEGGRQHLARLAEYIAKM